MHIPNEPSNATALFGFMALLFLVFAGCGAVIASYDITATAGFLGAAFAYAAWAEGRQ